jgi:hypothetical protein
LGQEGALTTLQQLRRTPVTPHPSISFLRPTIRGLAAFSQMYEMKSLNVNFFKFSLMGCRSNKLFLSPCQFFDHALPTLSYSLFNGGHKIWWKENTFASKRKSLAKLCNQKGKILTERIYV